MAECPAGRTHLKLPWGRKRKKTGSAKLNLVQTLVEVNGDTPTGLFKNEYWLISTMVWASLKEPTVTTINKHYKWKFYIQKWMKNVINYSKCTSSAKNAVKWSSSSSSLLLLLNMCITMCKQHCNIIIDHHILWAEHMFSKISFHLNCAAEQNSMALNREHSFLTFPGINTNLVGACSPYGD